MADLNVEIVTPDGPVFTGKVVSCTAPGTNGQFQILVGHAPFLANLQIGEIKLQKNNEDQKKLATSGGFLEVKDNNISIIVESAEFADDINVARAKEAEKRARKRLEEKDNIDLVRVDLALLRALNRLKVSSHL
jgi:F-type H+-transporting ATPase subunit epsilon